MNEQEGSPRASRFYDSGHPDQPIEVIEPESQADGHAEPTRTSQTVQAEADEPVKPVRKQVKYYTIPQAMEFFKTADARMKRGRYNETSVREYLMQIEPKDLAFKYVRMYDSHPAYKTVCAGAKHHHWWTGGLEQHVREMIGICFDIMDLYPGDFNTFTKTDVIIACFMHDFDKIWLYKPITEEDRQKKPDKYKTQQVFKYAPNGRYEIMDGYSMRLIELAKGDIIPTDQQWSAILFHESAFSPAAWQYGGPSDTIDTVNTKNLLAVLVNMADMYSSHFLGRSIA